jgi:2-polyprenyl-3-methyl-5-hydroxy-6-metoxy-1,4-benzoquinol methylase
MREIGTAGMKIGSLAYYRCVSCASSALTLIPEKRSGQEIIRGSLLCQQCKTSYSVSGGIPRFVSSENYSQSFGFQWNLHDKTQLDSYIGRPISQQRLFGVTGWPTDMSGQVILEAGSGAGRFTECLLKTGAQVFSFDYSSAVDSNWRNNGQSDRLELFQADMRNIPLRRGVFDKVICLGVLQHTPAPGASFKSLSEMVRPGGELVVDTYRKDVLSLLQWKYALRPITRRMNQRTLYRIVSWAVPLLLPTAKNMRRFASRAGARLMPIVEHSHLGLPHDLNEQWAILDTFDMYSPRHDHPQSIGTVRQWFKDVNFIDVTVSRGPNGVIGKGRRPE